ncbi:YopX family protein [Lactiplantibacillus plantarum]|uniref:YopX family protein n=1 Tax=Lactiplantibacillus plantarum TaxID=1590 RepID=UPI001F4C8B8E|nr:YopX family protein [Lactiplantibacillus plantarum]MCH8632253.1 YopX family protein [Lactiplantibacillus plantarum]MCH8635326.1 YopX family protein [Lactiplantibacillus plantarum]
MIKFRAWDDLLNKMLVVYRISFDGPVDGVQVHCYLDDRGAEGSTEYAYDGDGLILEQFTGLTDVNGKDIYEGDVIKSNYKYAQPKISPIIIENGNSYILGEDLATGNEMLVSDHISEIKVIGNVHTNPELLEEKK